MYRSIAVSAVCLPLISFSVHAHAIFPGEQTVKTVGDRAYVRFQAVNGRRDVSEFMVEVFDGDSWTPSRIAVASPARITVPAPDPGSNEAFDRTFSVLVDLDGKSVQKLRVCTKSIPRLAQIRSSQTRLNTRVCASVTVRKF